MGFNRKQKQAIIDGYLAESGHNMFVPEQFVDWLSERPDHDLYEAFFGRDDAKLAREYRIEMARKLASGLRISVTYQDSESKVLSITTREYPAYISPLAGRHDGGGYGRLDPDDPAHMAELREQGASALRGWLNRYRGAFEHAGVDLSALDAIAAAKEDAEAS